MSVAKSIVKISGSWTGIVVKKEDDLGQNKYYCVVDTKMFLGWNFSGTREDTYYFPYTEKEHTQKISAKGKSYKKGDMFSVFRLRFKPDAYIEFDNLLDIEDMRQKDFIEGTEVFGVKSTTPGVLGIRTPVSKIKYPIVRKGCISVISPCFDEESDLTRYYIDIGFKTVDGGGIYYYIKEDCIEKLIGMSKDIITRGNGRDTIYYDLAQVNFITEVKELILQIEEENR